jgi:two-component system response regulator BaeR
MALGWGLSAVFLILALAALVLHFARRFALVREADEIANGAAPLNEADAVLVDAALAGTVEALLQSRRKLLDEMDQALAAGDRPGLKRIAHKAAGGFAMYGFGWAAAYCRAVEHDAVRGDAADLGRRVAAVRKYLGGVQIRYRNAGKMEGE